MADQSPKLQLDKGAGPFVGRINRISTGTGRKGKWRLVNLTAITPWKGDTGQVNAGEEIVWFTPDGRDYEHLIDGAVIEIDRKDDGGAYRVKLAEGGKELAAAVANDEAALKALTKPAGLSGPALTQHLAAAYELALGFAVWFNRKVSKSARSAKDSTEMARVDKMYLTAPEVQSLAMHLLIAAEHGKYVLGTPTVLGQPGEEAR